MTAPRRRVLIGLAVSVVGLVGYLALPAAAHLERVWQAASRDVTTAQRGRQVGAVLADFTLPAPERSCTTKALRRDSGLLCVQGTLGVRAAARAAVSSPQRLGVRGVHWDCSTRRVLGEVCQLRAAVRGQPVMADVFPLIRLHPGRLARTYGCDITGGCIAGRYATLPPLAGPDRCSAALRCAAPALLARSAGQCDANR